MRIGRWLVTLFLAANSAVLVVLPAVDEEEQVVFNGHELAGAKVGDIVIVEGTIESEGKPVIGELVAGAYEHWRSGKHGHWETDSVFSSGPLWLRTDGGTRIRLLWQHTWTKGEVASYSLGTGRRAAGHRNGDRLTCAGVLTDASVPILDIEARFYGRTCRGGTRAVWARHQRFLEVVMHVMGFLSLAIAWAFARRAETEGRAVRTYRALLGLVAAAIAAHGIFLALRG